jgi:hypothetical protein
VHFQQDSAPPHYHRDVRKCLNTHFPGRWIGRAAQILWPPCSPDLTPLDFFLWGFVQDQVCMPPLPANVRAPSLNYRHSFRSDVRDAASHVRKN